MQVSFGLLGKKTSKKNAEKTNSKPQTAPEQNKKKGTQPEEGVKKPGQPAPPKFAGAKLNRLG